jgi:hypothetical protein
MKPKSLWKAYKIPRGISTANMNGGMERVGKELGFLAAFEASAVSELDRREVESAPPGTDLVGVLRKALQDISLSQPLPERI